MEGNLCLKELIRLKIHYYEANKSDLIERINSNYYQWSNESFAKFIPEGSEGISTSARVLCWNCMKEQAPIKLTAFYYCWSVMDPKINTRMILQTPLKGGFTLHLMGNQGTLFRDEEHKKYLLFNVDFEQACSVTMKSLTTGILSNYRILNEPLEQAQILPLPYLEINANMMSDGAVYNTFFEGKLIGVVKDSTVSYEIEETIRRQISNYDNQAIEFHNIRSLMTRQRELDSNVSEEPVSKRRRAESESDENALFTYDDPDDPILMDDDIW